MKFGKNNPRLLCYMSAVALSLAGCSQHTTKTKPSPVSVSDDAPEPATVVSSVTSPQSEARLFHFSKKGVRQVNVTDTNRTKRVQYEYANLWERLFDNYALPDVQNRAVDRELSWFVNHPTYLQRAQQRAEPFLYNIVQQIERQGVPGELALLPVVESAFQAQAVSPAKAAGIWQFIPTTGRNYGLKQNHAYDGRRDVYASTKAAIKYLKKLNRQFHGDWFLAVAAYNCGEGAVERAIRRNAYQGLPTDFWSLDLPQETRAYVPRLLAVSRLFAGADRYGLDLRDIPNEAKFKTVKVSHQLDLAVAADAADMSLEAFRAVNPGFKNTFVDPDGSVRLFVPAHKSKTFKKELARLASTQSDLLRREFESRPLQSEPDRYTVSSSDLPQTGNSTEQPRYSSMRVSALSEALKEPTRQPTTASRSTSFSEQPFQAETDPFKPTSFATDPEPAPAPRRSSAHSKERSSYAAPRTNTHNEASARARSASTTGKARPTPTSSSEHHASTKSSRTATPAPTRATNHAERVTADSRKSGKVATATPQKSVTKGKTERSSTLASPTSKTVVARSNESRKGVEKIVTAKADTVRLKPKR
ncbi:transglycosylase SLT domain-containing protein [Methylolobus aquaticus]